MTGYIYKTDKWWVSPYNFAEEVRKEMRFPKQVRLYDVTLRDGEQFPGVVFRRRDKVRIARALGDLGVQRIEAGMPVVSPEEKAAIKDVANLELDTETWGLCRCVTTDVDASLDCDVDGVMCEIASSDLKMKAYGFRDIEDAIKRALDTITYAKDHGLRVAFFPVDMTRASLENLETIYTTTVNEGHADEVVVVDTCGIANPEAIYYLTTKVKEWVNVPIHVHVHNDLGLATACSLAAVKAGAEWVHVSVNGLGERTGNADLSEVALSLYLLYGINTKLEYEKLREVSKLVEGISGVEVSRNKPVLGKDIFKRESGAVVAQLYRDMPEAVEAFAPELVRAEREVILGKKSGKYSILWKLKELEITATDEVIREILKEVKSTSEHKRRAITEEEFKKIISQVIGHA